MAALGCPDNMAAVMGAMEPMEEYVQVVVGEDGDPSQVVVVQGEGGELLRPVQELSPELLQSISPSDTVYYVQPDGSLVPGGSLGEVHTGGQGLEAAQLVTGGLEAAHLVTGGLEAAHLVTGGLEAAHLVTGGQGLEAAHLVTGGLEAAQLVTGGLEAAHLVTGGLEAAHLVTGGQGLEAAHLVTGGQGLEAAHLVTGGQGLEAAHLVTGGQGLEAAHLVTGGQGLEAAHLVTGGQGLEAAHLVTGGQGLEAAHLVTGGQGLEAAHLVTGGQGLEAAHLVTGGVEAAQLVTKGMEAGHLVTGGMEAAHLVAGNQGLETAQSEGRLETEDNVGEADGCEGQGMEVAVNLVTRVEEATHPEMILLSGEHPGVNLVTGGQIEQPVRSVNGGQEEESVEEASTDIVTALNLTKETARRAQETEAGLVPDTMQCQPVPAGGSRLSTFSSSISMLKTVAHQVALKEAESLPQVFTHKELKSIHVQVPKKSAEPVVLNLSTVHMKSANPSLLGAQVVHVKSLRESGTPLVVNTSSRDSPIQIFVRQAQPPAGKPWTPDLNRNGREAYTESQTCMAHPQNGAHVLYPADPTQKRGHKRKKSVKVKTRSGRISRPPKHKAKDYKFLKVGDMIQGSTSGSEDFSEGSSEEDEKGGKEAASCDLPPAYTVRNSLFQCQTCEKSYMGKGGLSRHYRLYPSHGQMETPFESDDKKNGQASAGHMVPTEPKKPIPRPRKRLIEDPLNPNASSLPSLATDGLEFVPVSSTCRGRRQMSGRRFGYPRKVLACAPSEQNARTARELIEQCEDADLKEHVAPCFSARLSVYDFLLVKVKQDHPDTPVFPHLYKELEHLHSMVRLLAQEYFSNGAAGRTVEVADCKVAASLDISAERITKVSPPVTSTVTEEKIQSVEENKCPREELTPPAKRLKVDELETVSSTNDVTTGSAADTQVEEQRTDPISLADESLCENVTSSEVTITCTEEVIEILHPNVMEEEAGNLNTNPESVPCEENIMETSSLSLSASSPKQAASAQISSEGPGESSGDVIQTLVVQENTGAEEVLPGSHTDQSPCPEASDTDSALPSQAPPTISDKTYSAGSQDVSTFISPDIIAGDQCTQTFAFHHGHDLVFVDSSDETMTGEAVVIYDSTEAPADTQTDTVVALVEMK
ncbi:zinc finger protein 839 isoform X2 [Dendropsophus ebraccatus]|uniref:zinc finger protein 839 isoform X2 n=1 Tax=Dendropsophus ebraccatus TaxID=150705 RepID=UPI003831B29E